MKPIIYSKFISKPYHEAVDYVKEKLIQLGFGIISEINMKETLKIKIDAEIRPYLIIGACNPIFAKKAIAAEKNIGIFLPCNVVIQQEGDETLVTVMNPEQVMPAFENSALNTLAIEMNSILSKFMQEL
ncbi:MAG: DUF302 domain-containing protein [Flavobacteriales bacterium]|nr:DUF302 domain-containing protein [Flavobacteriales bacterium]